MPELAKFCRLLLKIRERTVEYVNDISQISVCWMSVLHEPVIDCPLAPKGCLKNAVSKI